MTKPRLLLVEPDAYEDDLIRKLQSVFDLHIARPTDPASLRLSIVDVRPHVLLVGIGIPIGVSEAENAPELQLVACPATGIEHIDLEALARRRIRVISFSGRSTELSSVSGTAELAWALLLALARRLPDAFGSVRAGEWRRSEFQGVQLRGRCLAVVGHGRLGGLVAEYGRAFQMNLLVVDPEPKGNFLSHELCVIEEAFERADAISLHVPLTEKTENMVTEKLLKHALRAPLLINTSRGEVVDERAVAHAIRSGVLSGYGTDVISGDSRWGVRTTQNPITPLIQEGHNVVVTPHIGGLTREGVRTTRDLIVEDLLAEIRRSPIS